MNHQQWLEWRNSGIGSSDAPVIMGVSPWKTRYQLWQEKLSGKTGQVDNSSMARGRELEEVARCEFEKKMGISVFPKNVTHQAIDWMRASLDGIDLEGKVMVEIKCPNREDHSLAIKKMLPQKYYPQCQHQLMVTGLDRMFYYSFDGKDGVIVEVMKDPGYMESLWQEEHKFWDLKEKRIAPEFCENDYEDLSGNPEWNRTVMQWSIWRKSYKHAEEKEKEYKEKLLKICDHKNAIGGGIKLSKCISEGRIDIKKAMNDYPDIPWESYRRDGFEKIMIRDI